MTWTGGVPTQPGNGSRFDEHYLQIMQCWGEDDGTVPENPGPPPEQCVFGASGGVFGGIATALLAGRVRRHPGHQLAARGPTSIPSTVSWKPRPTNVWRSFRAVDGTVVNSHTDTDVQPVGPGRAVLAEPVLRHPDHQRDRRRRRPERTGRAPSCSGGRQRDRVERARLWPAARARRRGALPGCPSAGWWSCPVVTPSTENVGTPNEGVVTAPVTPSRCRTSAWRNRIAIPLEFNPVDTACELGADERRLVGTELVAAGHHQLAAGAVRHPRPAAVQLRQRERRRCPPAGR